MSLIDENIQKELNEKEKMELYVKMIYNDIIAKYIDHIDSEMLDKLDVDCSFLVDLFPVDLFLVFDKTVSYHLNLPGFSGSSNIINKHFK